MHDFHINWCSLIGDLATDDDSYSVFKDEHQAFKFFCILLWTAIIVGTLIVLIICFKPEPVLYSSQVQSSSPEKSSSLRVAPHSSVHHKAANSKNAVRHVARKSSVHSSSSNASNNHLSSIKSNHGSSKSSHGSSGKSSHASSKLVVAHHKI